MNTTRQDLIGSLLSVIRDNPNKTKSEHLDMFLTLVRRKGNETLVTACIDFFSSLNYNTVYSSAFPPSTAELRSRSDQRTEKLAEKKQELATRLTGKLMDLVLSTGKTLRDSTGAECEAEGGFLARVGKAVGPKGIVGKKMNEADLVELRNRQIQDSLPADRHLRA